MSNFYSLVRIGKDAQVRHTQAGKSVTGFSAAFDVGWGDKKQTNWLDCSLWGDRGEKVAPYLLKGSLVLVEGEIGTREHEGKTYLTLNVSEVRLTGKPPEVKPQDAKPQRQEAQDEFESDSIPF